MPVQKFIGIEQRVAKISQGGLLWGLIDNRCSACDQIECAAAAVQCDAWHRFELPVADR